MLIALLSFGTFWPAQANRHFCTQAVEADCATLGVLLKGMLSLLSKPQAAAHLFASEGHAQAGASTQEPELAASFQPAAATALGLETSQQNLQPPSPETTPAEAAVVDRLTTGKDAQPASAGVQSAVSDAVGSGLCSDEAAREPGTEADRESNMMKYQPGAWQSPAGADPVQNVSGTGPGHAPGQSQLPLAESLADMADASNNAVQKTDRPAASLKSNVQDSTDDPAESQPPAAGQSEPPQREDRHPKGQAGQDERQPERTNPPATALAEQLPVQAADAAPVMTDTISTDHLQLTPPETVATVPQHQTADRKQLSGVSTAEGGGEGGPGGVSKQQGAATGRWTGGLKMQLSGSAAQTLAVLQAGMPSRSPRPDEEAGW